MRSLRSQLLVTYVLALVLTTGLISAGLAVFLNWNSADIGRRSLVDLAGRLESCLRLAPGERPRFDETCEFFWIYAAAPGDLKYHLAEVSGPQNYVFTSTDLVRVAQEAVDYMTRLADRRSITFELSLVPERIVVADHSAVFVLFKNLIENAIQHSSSGRKTSHTYSRDSGAARRRIGTEMVPGWAWPSAVKSRWRMDGHFPRKT